MTGCYLQPRSGLFSWGGGGGFHPSNPPRWNLPYQRTIAMMLISILYWWYSIAIFCIRIYKPSLNIHCICELYFFFVTDTYFRGMQLTILLVFFAKYKQVLIWTFSFSVFIRFLNQEDCCSFAIMDFTITQCWDLILQINCQIIFTSGKMGLELITFQKVC